jgi:hypothetical protein
MKDRRAALLLLESALERLKLSANASRPTEKLRLFGDRM